MKINLRTTLLAGALIAPLLSQAATVAEWDFENSTETAMAPTNGQPFNSLGDGGVWGTADTVNNVVMHGWSAVGGPSFVEGVSPFGGFSMYSEYQDGYVWNDGNLFVPWTSPNWTLELHVRMDEANGWESFIAKMGSSFGVSESDFYLQRKGMDSNELRLNYMPADSAAAGDRIIVDGTNTLNAGQWYGLAVVADSTNGTITLYLDDGSGYAQEGQLTGLTNRNLGVYSSTFDWAFYRDYYDGGNNATIGTMDNVRFSNAALSLSELLSSPFRLSTSPEGQLSDPTPTIEATIINHDSDYVSAELFLNGTSVATDSTPSGNGTNIISFATAGLALTNHTAKVVVVGTDPAVTITNIWTFEVTQPAFDSVEITSPANGSWTTNTSIEVEAVAVENFETVSSASFTLDGGSPLAMTVDNSLAPTTTVSYAVTGLTHGVHTGLVVIVGSGIEVATNEVVFSIVEEVSSPTSLLHHWDFDENGGSTVNDNIGTADGTIIGTNFTWVSGALDLAGGGTSENWNGVENATVGSYVDLPNGTLSALPNIVTFEATYVADAADYWARIWDFGGTQDNQEDVGGAGAQYCFNSIGGPLVAISTENPNNELFQVGSGGIVTGEVTHTVWVYDADNNMTKFYKNGELNDAEVINGWPLSNMAGDDVNNWFGRAQWGGDPMFNGKLQDIRIYSGIMTANEVAIRYDEAQQSGIPTVAPVIQSINVAGSSVTLSWTAEDKGAYSIQRRTALPFGSWSTVVSNLPAGNFTTNVTASGAGAEFYQVIGEAR